MLVHFVVIAPESKQGTFTVRLPIVVGRSEEAKFRIQQDRVSRKHCEFFAQDGAVFIRDLGSTNGTFLDDQPVEASGKTPCPSGTVVRVGGLAFRVDYDVPISMRTTQIRPPPQDAVDLTVGTKAVGEPGPLEVHYSAEAKAEGVADRAVDAEAREVEAAKPPQEPIVEQSSDQADEPAAGPSAAADFGFLGAETADQGGDDVPPAWPAAGDAASAGPADDDEKLGDFFKGLK
jgi:predicted component of type VI protein secretion system